MVARLSDVLLDVQARAQTPYVYSVLTVHSDTVVEGTPKTPGQIRSSKLKNRNRCGEAAFVAVPFRKDGSPPWRATGPDGAHTPDHTSHRQTRISHFLSSNSVEFNEASSRRGCTSVSPGCSIALYFRFGGNETAWASRKAPV